jgi:8-amino-7-oxononanoate synthase
MQDRMSRVLDERERKGTMRRLIASDMHHDNTIESSHQQASIDFSSNDYLGIAQDAEQLSLFAASLHNNSNLSLGATGSRLLSGDSLAFHNLEAYLAMVHCRPAALLCNSGYDANLSVMSSLLCSCIIYDEYIHNSLHMGIRLWTSQQPNQRWSEKTAHSFRHNSLNDLKLRLQMHSERNGSDASVVVVVESVYSMD